MGITSTEEHKGPSIKDVRAKSQKIDPLPPCPKNVRTGSTPCPCRHTINFEKSEVFCAKKCRRPLQKNPLVRKMSALNKLPDCKRLLWMAPNGSCKRIRTPTWSGLICFVIFYIISLGTFHSLSFANMFLLLQTI